MLPLYTFVKRLSLSTEIMDRNKRNKHKQCIINPVKTLYIDNKTVVKVGKQTSETFSETKCVKQESCRSLTLFKIYLNDALRQWTEQIWEEMELHGNMVGKRLPYTQSSLQTIQIVITERHYIHSCGRDTQKKKQKKYTIL